MGRYRGLPELIDSPHDRLGVLVVNLGTPEKPTYGPVRRYLGQFLRDRRVIELCPYAWWPILYGPVLTFRPFRSAAAYADIWTPQGSPLMYYSESLSRKIALRLEQVLDDDVRVTLAMTYGEPSVKRAIETLFKESVRRLVVLPLYPQYSATTTGAVFDAVTRVLQRWRTVPDLRFISDFHRDEAYVAAVADRVERSWKEAGGRTHLLFSYHGIPVKYVEKGDPYRRQVERMSQLVADKLGLGPDDWSLSFQSSFGPVDWLQPFTDQKLLELLKRGIKDVTVTAPSFAVDCLETIEEIGFEYRELFLNKGGRSFVLVPALNDDEIHADALTDLVLRTAAGWPGVPTTKA
jgi:protoporphyrin/coproporphyrin ferrochelatase